MIQVLFLLHSIFTSPQNGVCAGTQPSFDPQRYEEERCEFRCKHQGKRYERCMARCRSAAKRSSFATVSNKKWKDWLQYYFPDASLKWGDDVQGAFLAGLGVKAWDFAGKGDYHRDGIPTAMLINTEALSTGELVVSRLVVAKWLNGKWKTLLDLDHGRTKVNGNNPDALKNPVIAWFEIDFRVDRNRNYEQKDFPGLEIGMAPLSKEGRGIGDGCIFRMVGKTKEYYFECG